VLDERVPGENDRTEVGRLARTVNVMLSRIQQAFAQRDATEAALRASEERLRRFVADASHELRTPLAAVSAYAELFDRGASEHPDDLRRVMTGIQGEASRMGRLVEDLFLLARLDEGRPLERQPVDLTALAAEAVQTATAVGPAWPVSLAAERPVEVIGDEARLRQVVDNLLANVRAHTPAGTPVVVSVSAVPTPTGPDEAVIEVADRGPGVGEGAARIFERFYRADPSRSRGGTGLGLAIVAAIVAAHTGRVAATDRPGGGTVVTVRLPLVPTEAPRPAGH
jgi:two-component system OmpR family sensor kinase